MKVTNQINSNECGVCVLKSLIDHYHHKDIPMDQLLNEANMSKQGLTLYDLENLANHYGLTLESYQAEPKDLIRHERKKPYILVINRNGLYHYVIAKTLTSKTIRIWCSENGEYDIHLDQLKNIWTGIYLSVDKNPYTDDLNFTLREKMSFINWKYLLLANFLSLLGIAISILTATFMQNVISLVINNNHIKNLLLLTFVYLFAFIMGFINTWLSNMIMQKRIYNHYQILHRKTLLCLNNKYLKFYQKIDWSIAINFDSYLYNVSAFYNTKLNKFISDIIVICTSTILVGVVQPMLLIAFFVSIALCLVTEFIRYNWLNRNLNKFKQIAIQYSNSVINWLEFKKANQYQFKNEALETQIKKRFMDNKDAYYKSNRFSNGFGFVDSLFNVVVYLLLINLACQMVIAGNLSFAQMTFCITLFEMVNGAAKSIYGIINSFSELKVEKQILYNIWNVGNVDKTGTLPFTGCDQIKVGDITLTNDTLLSGNSGCGKTMLLKRVSLMNEADSYMIDDMESSLYDINSLRSHIIYLSNDNYFEESALIKVLSGPHKKIATQLIQAMGINTLDIAQLSSGQKQALSFISLLDVTNKVILVDEALGNVDVVLKDFLLKQIKPIITKNNFLVVVDHNVNKKYFKREVRLDEKNA